jgi:hypothetical protein
MSQNSQRLEFWMVEVVSLTYNGSLPTLIGNFVFMAQYGEFQLSAQPVFEPQSIAATSKLFPALMQAIQV